jgi:hypothetical protein
VSTSEFDFCRAKSGLELFLPISAEIGDPGRVGEFDAIFGKMALVDDEPHSATAIAANDVELVPDASAQSVGRARD